MSSYLSEAFKKLSILNEEDFNIANMEDVEDAKSFMDMVDDGVEEVRITDIDAPTVDDLLDSYIGKTILDCCVCHSKLYKNPEDVHIDEEGTLANIDEECPYCFSNDGYKVIGVVAPFEEEINVEEENEIEDEKEQDDSETEEVETEEKEEIEEIEESLNESADISEYQKWVDFDMGKYHRISDITMDKIKKAGLSVVKDQYGDYEIIADRKDEGCHYNKKGKKAIKEEIEEVELNTEEQEVTIESDKDETIIKVTEKEDTIAPVPDDMKQDIEIRSEEENTEAETEEKEDKFVDVDVDEFDEESFDRLGESFLKNVYNNVDSFKTTEVSSSKNNIFVEGLIKFTSGNEKKTKFVFEAKDASKRGKVRFYGMNENFAKSRKPFTVTGRVNEGKFISESMNYNYMTKVNGESKRICGSVSLKEERKRLDKDLSTVKGSMTNILQDYIGKMEGKTKEEIVADVEKLFKDNNLDTQASRKKLAQLRAAKNADEAMFIISSSVLYGSNLGV